MDPFQVVLELLGEPIVERRYLPDGTNPWELVVYDRSAERRYQYARTLEERGVVITCENPDCGKQWKIHPAMVGHTFACSVRCSSKMYTMRKKGLSDRTPQQLSWKPWERSPYTQRKERTG